VTLKVLVVFHNTKVLGESIRFPRGTYDAALLIEGHRFDKKRIHKHEALAISIGDGPPMQLLVNRVGKNDISGY
jgi:hypothetical protein